MLEEDKILIWSKRVADLEPQPDTVLLIVSKLQEIFDLGGCVMENHDSELKEDWKMWKILLEYHDLDLKQSSIPLLILRLKAYHKYRSKMIDAFQGLYGKEFNDVTKTLRS